MEMSRGVSLLRTAQSLLTGQTITRFYCSVIKMIRFHHQNAKLQVTRQSTNNPDTRVQYLTIQEFSILLYKSSVSYCTRVQYLIVQEFSILLYKSSVSYCIRVQYLTFSSIRFETAFSHNITFLVLCCLTWIRYLK